MGSICGELLKTLEILTFSLFFIIFCKQFFLLDIIYSHHMKLTSFSFILPQWSLSDNHLHDISLLVGENAVGKTRTLSALKLVADHMTGHQFFGPNSEMQVLIKMTDDGREYDYSYSVSHGKVQKEAFIVDGVTLIRREEEIAQYYENNVNPPINRLLINTRRDTQLYLDVEKVLVFMDSIELFSFSSIRPGDNFVDPIKVGNGLNVSTVFSDLSPDERKRIIKLLNDFGFKVGNLRALKAFGNTMIAMKETGVPNEFIMWAFSTGLIRVISLLTFLFYLSANHRSGLVLIDDMGEGLDYYRSTALGKFVSSFCKENQIQLILTTNDSFLMNVIDVKEWIILRRTGANVTALSEDTNPILFRRFRMTGLSNFDLLRSDFIDQNIGEI